MRHPIVEEELGLLQQVLRSLEEGPRTAVPSEAAVVEELARLRELLAEGVKAEDLGALTDQWNRQTALLDQLRASRGAPRVDPRSPYFAHLRLREGGAEREILLGKATWVRPEVAIVDWRNAPISKIYYRYGQGEEYEEEIAGRDVAGTVIARRALAIRDRSLQRIDAPEGTFTEDPAAPGSWRCVQVEPPRLAGGEGAALRAHGAEAGGHRRLGTDLLGTRRRADKHLPDIAGLIDASQFDLIVRPSAGFVVIRGTAGSGKTTVALHRIAYLAYDDPAIDGPQTLVVVFSRALRDYVSHVLPALGVERVQVRTFREWAAEQVRRLFPKLPRAVRDTAVAVVQRLKLHPGMLTALERQAARVAGRSTPRQVIDDWASVLTQADFLQEVFDEVAPGAFTAGELGRAAAWNRERYDELTAWMGGDDEAQADLDAEDHALLLRAWQLRCGPLPAGRKGPLRYRHIAVDEVQDFAPLEVRILLDCLDDRRSITLAGDTQQHLMEESGFTSWSDFFRHLGVDGAEVNTLRVSYRSSREIAEFALGVLGDLREDEVPPVTTRSGPPVEFFRFVDHGACVAFLADALKELLWKEPVASVAILAPSRALSAIYHRGLATGEVPRIHLVEQQDFTFAPGVEVTEVEQVKGLEFDYVILVEVSAASFPDTAAARRRLHVGATRAVHQLWLTSVATPSPLLRVPPAAFGKG